MLAESPIETAEGRVPAATSKASSKAASMRDDKHKACQGPPPELLAKPKTAPSDLTPPPPHPAPSPQPAQPVSQPTPPERREVEVFPNSYYQLPATAAGSPGHQSPPPLVPTSPAADDDSAAEATSPTQEPGTPPAEEGTDPVEALIQSRALIQSIMSRGTPAAAPPLDAQHHSPAQPCSSQDIQLDREFAGLVTKRERARMSDPSNNEGSGGASSDPPQTQSSSFTGQQARVFDNKLQPEIQEIENKNKLLDNKPDRPGGPPYRSHSRDGGSEVRRRPEENQEAWSPRPGDLGDELRRRAAEHRPGSGQPCSSRDIRMDEGSIGKGPDSSDAGGKRIFPKARGSLRSFFPPSRDAGESAPSSWRAKPPAGAPPLHIRRGSTAPRDAGESAPEGSPAKHARHSWSDHDEDVQVQEAELWPTPAGKHLQAWSVHSAMYPESTDLIGLWSHMP